MASAVPRGSRASPAWGQRGPRSFGIAAAAGLEAAGISCWPTLQNREPPRADSPGLSQRLQPLCRWVLGMQVGGGATSSQGLVPAADCRSYGASPAARSSAALLATASGHCCFHTEKFKEDL